MKNGIAYGALTFAFTIAGACISAATSGSNEGRIVLVAVVSIVGGFAAAFSSKDF